MKVANIHCHFMNSSHVPDSYMRNFEGFFKKIIPFLDADKFWYKNRIIDNYVRKGQYCINDNSKETIISDDIEGYHLITPLMMNMVAACSTREISKDEYEYEDPFTFPYNQVKGSSPFIVQVYEYSLIAALYPYRVFPFIVYNPLVQASTPGESHLDLCKHAINDLGFVGIKMYPAHGYSPDPYDYLVNPSKRASLEALPLTETAIYNEFKPVGKALLDFYAWANSEELPITSHCQYVAMQKVVGGDDDNLAHKSDPDKWRNVLKNYPKIRVNFAHFGGNEYSEKCSDRNTLACIVGQCNYCDQTGTDKKCLKMAGDNKRAFSLRCLNRIVAYANDIVLNEKNRIFADVSAHFFKLKISNLNAKEDQSRYVNHLKSIMDYQVSLTGPKLKLMFGTDTPVPTLAGTTDKKYLDSYRKVLDGNRYKPFYWDNAVEFVFGPQRKIRQSYINFIKRAETKYCLQLNLDHLNRISNDGVTVV